jgi:hypothetical protein
MPAIEMPSLPRPRRAALVGACSLGSGVTDQRLGGDARQRVPSSDPARFDVPDETCTVTLTNLPETARPPTVGAYDPLHDASTSARLLSREGTTAVFELAASDYPRLLTLDYSGS